MSISAITLLGAPGAGKGTIAAGIKEQTKLVHVSTGDLLRDAVRDKSEVGVKAESYMKRGELVPDDIVLRIVADRIASGSSDASYMFDGFPRTLAQAQLLKKHFGELGAVLSFVFLLEVSKDIVLDRLGGRRVCGKCGASFHVRNIPPKKEGICDYCGGELLRRPDDKEETILNRLEVFHRKSADLFKFYETQGILVRVDSSGHRSDVVRRILAVLNEPKKC